ncbi:MAG: hypothetical protein SF069_09410 [Phycisphaerae bacterium]|nr:hypothetical protein [Phycisphaerae bacterium]
MLSRISRSTQPGPVASRSAAPKTPNHLAADIEKLPFKLRLRPTRAIAWQFNPLMSRCTEKRIDDEGSADSLQITGGI